MKYAIGYQIINEEFLPIFGDLHRRSIGIGLSLTKLYQQTEKSYSFLKENPNQYLQHRYRKAKSRERKKIMCFLFHYFNLKLFHFFAIVPHFKTLN